MRKKAIIQALTGTTNIVCESIETDNTTGAINIIAHPDGKSQYRCGICRKKSPKYDNGSETRKWRCLDIGGTKAYVVAKAPRVCCKEHGVVTAYVSWARHKSRFCSAFEDTVAWRGVFSSKKLISELISIE